MPTGAGPKYIFLLFLSPTLCFAHRGSAVKNAGILHCYLDSGSLNRVQVGVEGLLSCAVNLMQIIFTQLAWNETKIVLLPLESLPSNSKSKIEVKSLMLPSFMCSEITRLAVIYIFFRESNSLCHKKASHSSLICP